MKAPLSALALILLIAVGTSAGWAEPPLPTTDSGGASSPGSSVGPAFAPTNATEAPRLAAGAPYILAPNDQIAILVRGHQELSVSEAVRPDGKIAYPELGAIQAAGRTVDQLREQISLGLSTYLLHPDVNITILSYHQERVYVLGAVRTYGPVTYTPGMSAQDAIGLAGGTDHDADLGHIVVERNHKTIGALDLTQAVTAPIQLEPDDAIVVPKLGPEKITVVGAVKDPGTQLLQPHERLLDALTTAGLVTPQTTTGQPNAGSAIGSPVVPDLGRVTLTRENTTSPVDVNALLKGEMQQNLLLEPGDVIYVPEQRGTVTVLGEVEHPQTLRLVPGMKVLDAVNLAGGPTDKADTRRAVLQRLDGTTVEIKLEDLLKGKDVSQNVQMQDGDVVTVPTNRLRVAVLGQVNKPGVYDYKPGDDVVKATLLAGGTVTGASLKNVSLIRFDPQGQPKKLTVNMEQIVKTGNNHTDQPLQPGDIIYVGSRSQGGSVVGTVLPILSTLSYLRVLVPGLF